MREYLQKCRFFFVHTGILSFFINLLQLTIPLYFLQVFDRVVHSRSVSSLLMLTAIALWVVFFAYLLDVQRSKLLARAGTALDDSIGGKVLQRQLDADIRPVNNLSEDYLADVARLRVFLSGSPIRSFFDLPWGVLFLALMFLFHPALGYLTLGAAILLGILAFYQERATRQGIREANANQQRANRFVQNAKRNAEVVGAMGMAGALSRRWEAINHRVKELQLKTSDTIASISGIADFIRTGMRIVIIGTSAYLIISDQSTPGIAIAATLIFRRAMNPIEGIIHNWRNIDAARSAYDRLTKLLGEDVFEPEKLLLPDPEGRLEVERLFFRFGQAEPLLRNISFTLEAGESLAVIGPSGSGKTTLVRLLNGLWMPSSGAVRLDGAEIHAWDKSHLGQFIGYLPQGVELFDGTVAENVCRLAEVSECTEQIVTAAKLARAHELILRLPKGYETPLGEGGVRLSGGQQQRIAFARALFGTPKLIVLDEPNSNLDAEGENALLDALRDIRKAGITTICIVHKLSLIRNFDMTLMLKNDGSYQFGKTREITTGLGAPGITPALPAPETGGRPQPEPAAGPQAKLQVKGLIGKQDDVGIKGWAYFPEHPELVPTIEIHVDEQVLGITQANLFRGDLARHDVGTGYHGFEFKYPPEAEIAGDPGDRLQAHVLIPGGGKAMLPKA